MSNLRTNDFCLVTTADERTWPKEQPILFLGEWCRLYNRKEAWKDLDAEVVPYHWDDREKLYRDYLSLQKLYEELLWELSEKLNVLHGVRHSLRYWRILVGPWLSGFVQVLFDRWAMIEQAISRYSIAGVSILDCPPEEAVPNDMNEFITSYVGDTWNEAIYGQLLAGFTNIRVEKVFVRSGHLSFMPSQDTLPLRQRVKRKFAGVLMSVQQRLVRRNEAFFMSSCLPLFQDLLLQWRLGQVPKLWRSPPSPKAEVDWSSRQWSLPLSCKSGFSSIVRAMIPRHIPILYLEGFDLLCEKSRDLPWPQKPRFIFTSNAYNSDDLFKAWTAEKAELGSPLVIGQHGGSYGTTLWDATEAHQQESADLWLSWGWSDKNNSKVKPVGNLKLIGRKINWDPNGGALLVEVTPPRYAYRMFSVPVASQWLDYFNDQCRFVDALPAAISRELQIRLYPQSYGWCAKERWQDRFPDILLDDGVIPLEKLIRKSRVYISTYNATTFLESLAINIPTIMFWNPKHWELRESAIPYFDQLKAVGIFHDNPESAAQHLAKIWDHMTTWWNSESVQSARETFCQNYSCLPNRFIGVLEDIMGSVGSQRPAVVV